MFLLVTAPMNRALYAAIALAMLGISTGCGDDLCANTVIAERKSPDGTRTAFLFERDCGATTDFTTQVSVLRAESLPEDAGNVFVADSDHGAAPRAPWGGPPAEIRWVEDGMLEVRYPRNARTHKKVEAIDGVSIRYSFLGADKRPTFDSSHERLPTNR